MVKYHGDLLHPETVIFTGSSYADRIADAGHFLNIRLRSDVLAKGFVFIGYGFGDPNIRLLFEQLKAVFGKALPPSYLIAYHYDPSMEKLKDDYGVEIVDPKSKYPGVSHNDAFVLFLKDLSELVLRMKAQSEAATLLSPGTPSSFRVATKFDVAAVVKAASQEGFAEGLKVYRALLDRTKIPLGLEDQVLMAFRSLCDAAASPEDLEKLAGAVFNLSLPPPQALEALSRLMVAINRINDTAPFPCFMIATPTYNDELIVLAAILAVAEIERDGDTFNEAFRLHAQAWMRAFAGLAPEVKNMAELAMATAWHGTGSPPPTQLFERSVFGGSKGFSDIKAELMDRLPRKLYRPPF